MANVEWGGLGLFDVRQNLRRYTASVTPESGKVEQCLSPVLANCSGVDQIALFHKKKNVATRANVPGGIQSIGTRLFLTSSILVNIDGILAIASLTLVPAEY